MPDQPHQNGPKIVSQQEMDRHTALPTVGPPVTPKRQAFACLFWLIAIPVMLFVGLLAPAILILSGAVASIESKGPLLALSLIAAGLTCCFIGLCGPGLLWHYCFAIPDPKLASQCLKCGKSRMAKGYFNPPGPLPHFVLTTPAPTNTPPKVALDNTVYVCTECGVVKCSLRPGFSRTLGRPTTDRGPQSPGIRCPHCRGTSIVKGKVDASRFSLETKEVECVFMEWACQECGCLFGRSNAREIRDLIARKGSRALKRRLGL